MTHAAERSARRPPRPTSTPVAVASLLLCCALWGLNQVAAKVALAEIPPLTQAAARSLGAALLVLAWARWRGIALAMRDGTLRGGLAAGALFAAEFACIFIGLQFTSASRMVVFIYLSPFVVALGMPFIARGERLVPTQWLGLLLAFAGVAWAFAEGFAPGTPPAPRNGWAIHWASRRRCSGPRRRWSSAAPRWPAHRPKKPCCTSCSCRARCWRLAARAGRRALAGTDRRRSRCRRWHSRPWCHVRQLPALVLAGAPLPGHAPGGVHAVDARWPAWSAGVGLLGEPLTLRLVLAVVARWRSASRWSAGAEILHCMKGERR